MRLKCSIWMGCVKQASTEKVQALMRISQAEQSAEQAFNETGDLLGQIADLRDRVKQASALRAIPLPLNLKASLWSG